MKYVGKSIPIHDAVGKATGKLRYAGDMRFQGMLHMALVFSKIPHGKVLKLDCTKALNFPGVVDVIHCFNTTSKCYNRYQTQYRQELIKNENIFNEHVRFVGDRIAGVIAITEGAARRAVELVEVEYEEYPYALSMEEAVSGKIEDIYEHGAICGEYSHEVGEKEEGEDFVYVKTQSDLSRIHHACMETHVCIADYNEYMNKLTIYSPNQAVFGIRTVLAELFEMDFNSVRVLKTTMGGSFGAKQEWVLEPVVAAAALKVGRPVKLSFNRSETMISTYGRSPMHFETEFAFSKNGKLKSVEIELMMDTGAYVGNAIGYSRTVAHKLFRAYTYPYAKYHSKAIITNNIVGGAFRGWTSPEETIMFEHAMNVAANRLGMDPLELRLLNVMPENGIDLMSGKSVGHFQARKAIEKGRECFEWDKKKGEVKVFNAENIRYKRGIAVSVGGHVNNFYPGKTEFTRVSMRLSESGSVHCNITLHDHGCGTVTVMKMLAAEELALTPDQIFIEEGDTDKTPYDVGCFSSRTTYVQGRAIVECAKKLKEQIILNVSEYLHTSPENLFMEDQRILSRDKRHPVITWNDVFDFSVQNLKREIFVNLDYVPDTNPGVAGVHFALVEVDTYTGMVKIVEYLAVHDIGQAINREMCIAQTQGAVIMGSGAALYEHILTRANGVSSGSLKDYHLINAPEAPNVKVIFIEEGQTEGPYGAKSIGEVCHTPVTAAVAGAVNNALGSELGQVPLTPDVILAYLNQKEEN